MAFKCGGNSFYMGEEIVYRGEYDPNEEYTFKQVVSLDGLLWRAQQDISQNNEPSEDSELWESISAPPVVNNYYDGVPIVATANDLLLATNDAMVRAIVYVKCRYNNDDEQILDTPKVYYYDQNIKPDSGGQNIIINPHLEDDGRWGCYVLRDRCIDISWWCIEAKLLLDITPAADGVPMGYNEIMMSRADYISSYASYELMTLEEALVIYDQNKAKQTAFIDSFKNIIEEISNFGPTSKWTFTFRELEMMQKLDDDAVMLHIEDMPKIIQAQLGSSYSLLGDNITIEVYSNSTPEHQGTLFFYEILETNYQSEGLLPTWVYHKRWYHAVSGIDGINDTDTLIKEEYLCTDGTISNVPCS
ncbi:MAG: hypothetical protein PHI79_03445 [Sulfurovaceae bacterium]|nr:hypothetical protein [Sulfurovaceae bacterium]MDD5548636.1 hypothetical protein [Sulfurovaceae bacterium]